MKLFADTADTTELRALADLGIIDGVTTNPSLIAKTGRSFAEVVEEIVSIIDGPISAEVISTEAEAMVKEGRENAAIHPNIVVKIPTIPEGLKATRILREEGIKVNMTLCFSANQALLCAKAGATYVSPFIGRLDDIGQEGMQLIEDICEIYANYESLTTEVLVASVRHPMHVVEAARLGADICTIPPAVLKKLAQHPLTDKGLAAFLADWEKTGQSILDS
jgi:transaldolase